MKKLPGITRKEEEAQLAMTIALAEQKLQSVKDSVKSLADELHTMQEEFNASDKEMQQIWLNTDARFKEVSRELYRAEQARKKPYFGRIDFCDTTLKQEEAYYIGRHAIARDPVHPEVIDWRSPIAGVYYGNSLGKIPYTVKGEGKYEIDLHRKRTYEIEQDILKDFYDSDVVANDELLTRYLAKNKRAVLSEIIATIQQEQNEAIRKKPQHNMIVQGAAGSGKTTVAMHRISYILYNYDLEFTPEDFYIIGSNQVLLNYITGVLPELNVYGVSQMTMEQLFVRLLYEEWDPKSYRVKPVIRNITPPIKGTSDWFHALEKFCHELEWTLIPREDVRIEQTGVLLLSRPEIEATLTASEHLSRADKITRLTEILQSRLENEISGKYYSYSPEEKKKLIRTMQNWFGKREWKGSVFALYRDFLEQQRKKGVSVEDEEDAFDLYDLASLAYLYKRIRETEIIREAGHVVIDEAQDFGMMVYRALKYCLSKCTYTIMGDVSQNISLDYGLNDWTELRELMLPDPFDTFSLLQKSYRNTIEISQFATEILYHGDFQIYPIQPIVRHGHAVQVVERKNVQELLSEALSSIEQWKQEGYETIAVICRDEAEAGRIRKLLGERTDIVSEKEELTEFRTGVMVLSLEYVKGLEFDAVLIFNASADAYPVTDGYVKRLYVAATRALHELKVLHAGSVTHLISDPVPEEKKQKAVVKSEQPGNRGWTPPEEKTNDEIAREQAAEGAKDMERRNYIGPKRIVIRPEEKKTDAGKKTVSDGKQRAMMHTSADSTSEGEIHSVVKTPVSGNRNQGKEYIDERHLLPGSEFGSAPDTSELRPEGHSRIDCSIRLCMKGKGYYDLVSSYGTLRVMPVAENRVWICFSRTAHFPVPDKNLLQSGFQFKSRETRTGIDLVTSQMWIKIDKKTGAVVFCHADGKPFLAERAREPRQMGQHRNYVFFDWDKKEKLEARGITDYSFLRIGQLARYISFGKTRERMACLASEKGYRILVPAGWKTLCCNLAVYGPYLSMESGSCLEYYVEKT